MQAIRTFSLDKKIFNSTLYSNLLKFWFDGLPLDATAPTKHLIARWFGLGDKTTQDSFDEECRSGFSDALSLISPTNFPLPKFEDVDKDRGHYADIAAPFMGQFYRNGSGIIDAALGLTLLLDQIPRNVFRKDQVLIYGHYDRIARAVFEAVQKHQLDRHERYLLSPVHRLWFYMPLVHSESLDDHQLFETTMKQLQSKLEANGDQASQYVAQALDSEERHSDILRKFGRYPYRNECLGRETSYEEQEWLDAGGERFGS